MVPLQLTIFGLLNVAFFAIFLSAVLFYCAWSVIDFGIAACEKCSKHESKVIDKDELHHFKEGLSMTIPTLDFDKYFDAVSIEAVQESTDQVVDIEYHV